ncbi:MAG TPA: YiiX/YebB-like N1pC/P60 family cysteine hydrolase [Pirellulales bacterium]|nr:YiiX/YebB-like N1pC/P60 family cysteine hydrolase [Pirellulales bacterium]
MQAEQIEAGARTVAHMAAYFDELKVKARELLAQGQAGERGYFTPSEDEAVRQLLVSYWQSRSALFELVLSCRDDVSTPGELRPAAFLVAFAAAALLIDAARFLREEFADRTLAVKKLNEPEPHFGIPAGTYDMVQKSLTNPRHAWHLYHARDYFQRHESELRRLGVGKLAVTISVIDRLGQRLDVAIADLARARLRFRAAEATGFVRHDLVGRSLYGLQKLVAGLAPHVWVKPGHRPALPARIAEELRNLVEPGDVLITRKEYAISNYFLPGYWPHAALYLGDAAALERLGLARHANVRPRWSHWLESSDEPRKVLEALADGVRIRPLTSPFGCDSLVVVRPRLAPSDIAAALARGLFHDGKPYDFDFDFTRSDRLACTEVVYRAYEGLGGVKFELSRRAGRLVLAASDLLRMARARVHFEPLAVYAPAHAPNVLRGQAAEELLEQKDEG